jgi:glyoxylase-like metal-dependent hydrolase (beta-lactamase superfamily II)/ferredoxin
MARIDAALDGNVGGNFFVDDTCIDCDLCRQIAPETFTAEAGQSVVSSQPESETQTHQAQMALVVCPTGSIGTRKATDLKDAIRSFPIEIEEGVYFCGFASRYSYGAASYLIVRPEGNILVDSPRFTSSLARGIAELGGISMMFLTHRDDVADHQKFHDHFGCERIIHRAEGRVVPAERFLDGRVPVSLGEDLTAIPTPGHTRGHAVLHYKDRFLFTGDHLAWSPRYEQLVAFRELNWYSWPETIKSMAELTDYRFEWVLPGHGRRAHFEAEIMSMKMAECVEWMKQVA